MKRSILILLFLITSVTSYGVSMDQMQFHCENDTIKITQLLVDGAAMQESSYNALTNYYAMQLLETPYVANTLNGETEMLSINIHQLDCTTFMETLIALSITTKDGKTSWRDYANNLERIRYRNGIMDGYASRLHYISDWVVNNFGRGIIKEVTGEFAKSTYKIITLNFMTTHRDSYPALADEEVYEQISSVEDNYRTFKMPIILKKYLVLKYVWEDLREGDLIALTTDKVKGLDATHVGIVHMVDGVPHLLHASSKSSNMRVVIDPETLPEMIRKSKSNGIRVFRIANP
ncbi:MAG: DUF1460 domain-containing protein [Bacteroidales bacterium]